MKREPLPWDPRSVLAAGFAIELLLVAVAAVVGYFSRGTAFPFRWAFDAHGLLWAAASSLPMVALAAVFASPLLDRIPAFRRIGELVERFLGDFIRSASSGELLSLAAAAGIGEEVLFRGVLQTITGPWGLWIASVVFGLLHALTPTYFLITFLLGLYFGWLRIESDNVLVPACAHAVFDAVALLRLRQDLNAKSRDEDPEAAAGA